MFKLKRKIEYIHITLNDTAYKLLVRQTLQYALTVCDPIQQNNKHRVCVKRL